MDFSFFEDSNPKKIAWSVLQTRKISIQSQSIEIMLFNHQTNQMKTKKQKTKQYGFHPEIPENLPWWEYSMGIYSSLSFRMFFFECLLFENSIKYLCVCVWLWWIHFWKQKQNRD